MLAGIKEVLIVNRGQTNSFKKIFKDGKDLGIKIYYKEQAKPNGLPEAFIIGEKFINNENIALILGDNFFYAQSLTKTLQNSIKLTQGASFLHPVKNPKLYGIATIDSKNKIKRLIEKPTKTKSNLAVTGLYFFDKKVVNYSKQLKPSKEKS